MLSQYLMPLLCTPFAVAFNAIDKCDAGQAVVAHGPQAIQAASIEDEWCSMKGGQFRMGSPDYVDPDSIGGKISIMISHGSMSPMDEGPPRLTTVTKDFKIARTKVTAQQFCDFLNQSDHPELYVVVTNRSVITYDGFKYAPHPGKSLHAANTVTWEGAVAYCEWLSKRIGKTCRLPTEAEWELCARGPEGRRFPWGSTFEEGVEYGTTENSTMPVGSFPANRTPEGVCDMIGPTAEWCSDWYAPKYDPEDTIDPQGPIDGTSKVMRGRRVEGTFRFHQSTGADGVQGWAYGFRVLMEDTADPQ